MNVLELLSLKGKVAIITGGAGYLGRAMTLSLCEAGADVYVLSRNKASFDQNSFDKEHIFFLKGDIMDSDSIKSCYETVVKERGHIDILINNAFTMKGDGFPEDITDEMWAYSSDGLIGSIFRCTREVIPYMKKNGYGKIINISSMYGVVSPNLSVYEGGGCEENLNPINYGTFKAGVIQMTKYFATYLIKSDINVNCITPGPYPSEEVQKNCEFIKRLSEKNPSGRIGTPDDLKGVTLLLASDASKYIVGQNIIVDGGWTIW